MSICSTYFKDFCFLFGITGGRGACTYTSNINSIADALCILKSPNNIIVSFMNSHNWDRSTGVTWKHLCLLMMKELFSFLLNSKGNLDVDVLVHARTTIRVAITCSPINSKEPMPARLSTDDIWPAPLPCQPERDLWRNLTWASRPRTCDQSCGCRNQQMVGVLGNSPLNSWGIYNRQPVRVKQVRCGSQENWLNKQENDKLRWSQTWQ